MIAALLIRAAIAILPASQRHWGEAMRCEAEMIEAPVEAAMFAAGCLTTAIRQAFLQMGSMPLNIFTLPPRRLTVLCAIAATGLGLVHMSIAGAPPRYLAMNGGALILGLIVTGLVAMLPRGRASGAGFIPALGPILLLTSLFGVSAAGAARWVSIGGLSVQLSLVLMPVMAIAFARTRDTLSTIGIVVAAAGLAVQPDRAMAGALAAAMAALLLTKPDRNAIIAFVASALGFAVTLFRADTLPAMPFVDQILYSSFAVHPAAGCAVLAGVAIMLLPALAGYRDTENRATFAAFGALWLAIIAAAALGNYPTPIVGYGGSAILGYVLGLLALPVQFGGAVLPLPRKRGADSLDQNASSGRSIIEALPALIAISSPPTCGRMRS